VKNIPAISFEFISVSINGFQEETIRNWVYRAIVEEGEQPQHILFIFCDDEYLYSLNNLYLNHQTLTDVITFNYNADLGRISGDIFISYERIIENAKKFNELPERELRRVIIHGVLHLLGYNDFDASSKRLMRSKENYYLSLCVF
jgi:probable rRNA maturation factor